MNKTQKWLWDNLELPIQYVVHEDENMSELSDVCNQFTQSQLREEMTHLLEQVEELKGGKMYKSEYPYRCAIEAIDIRIRSLMEGEKYLTQKGEKKK